MTEYGDRSPGSRPFPEQSPRYTAPEAVARVPRPPVRQGEAANPRLVQGADPRLGNRVATSRNRQTQGGFSLRQLFGGGRRTRRPLVPYRADDSQALYTTDQAAEGGETTMRREGRRSGLEQGRAPVSPSPLVGRQRTGTEPPTERPMRLVTPNPNRSAPTPISAASGNKVTPLRSRQVWPPEGESDPALPRNRNTARPRGKSAPVPLLYAIRLIILGVGVAAIAGTLLSILNPDRVVSDQASTAPGAEQAAAPRTSNTGFPSFRGTALTLGTELTHLENEINQLVAVAPGLTESVFLLDLDSNNYVDIGGSEPMAAASTIKVPILLAFLQAVDAGKVDLNQLLVLRPDQIVGGSGEMQTHPPGSQYTALEVASHMIIDSDNTATNMIIELLGGADTLNQYFQTLGLEDTVIRNPLPDLDGTNTTSTRDLTTVMVLVNQGKLLSERSRDRMLSIMQRTRTRTLIPSGVGDDALVANKTGDIASSIGDVAIVDLLNGKRYALAVLVSRPYNDGRAGELVRRTSQLVYQELNQPVAPVGTAPPVPPGTPETSESQGMPQGTTPNPNAVSSPNGTNGTLDPMGSPENGMPSTAPQVPQQGEQLPQG